ncbi:DNA-processing protein DprA [Geomonas oryzisoli]|uniref:DNA-processing protein DprA n=1 Tax=Geomonas oryzisoli TaxID=2847992 RepID=A0ABX8JAI1_9BACT|nr:DNA-processing protein DprA [Geomonas oryzisoli]QWV93684.1 DNA-processing protein DprA [Geomonas oryzisoli]
MHSIGNAALLKLRKVAFLCSRKFPHEAAEKAYDWAEAQRAAGTCVISGYHSPIEKEVLCRLLRGSQPIIIALAQGLHRLDPEWERHMTAGRLLVISRYAQSVSHPCESKCYQRNKMMIDLADTIVIAHASPGGSLERLCSEHGDKVVLL